MTEATSGNSTRPVVAAAGAVARRSPLLVFIVITVAIFGVARPSFLSVAGFLDIGQQIAVTAIVAYAMTAVIVARGIDISVGATLAVSGVVGAQLLSMGLPGPLAIVACVLTGALIGALNGALIGFLGVSPLIATLGTMAFGNGRGARAVGCVIDPGRRPRDDPARRQLRRPGTQLTDHRRGLHGAVDVRARAHGVRALDLRGRG